MTDATGSVLYFVTDHMRLGEPDTPHGKVFRWDRENGVRIFWQEPKVERQMGNSWSTNYYRADDLSLSGDGGLLAIGAVGEAQPQPRMAIVRTALATIQDAKGNVVRQSRGTSFLSRNGKFFLENTPPSVPRLLRRFDSDIQIQVPFPSVWSSEWRSSRQAVSDEGHVVYPCNGVCLVTGVGPPPPPPMPPVNPPVPVDPNLRTPITRRLPASVSALAPAISASGNTVIYESLFEEGQCRRLFALDVKTGKETLLFVDGFPERYVSPRLPLELTLPPYSMAAGLTPMFGASVDDAGRLALALVREDRSKPRQWLLVMATDGSTSRWFGPAAEGYREAILSGDGQVVFAVTESGRIVRIDLLSETREEILPATPFISRVTGPTRPGALNRITGGGLASETAEARVFPAASPLAGIRVDLDGKPIPVLGVSPSEITVQIPWEQLLTGSAVPLRVMQEGSAFAAPPVLVDPSRSGGVAEPGGIVHPDGQPVSLDSPARPGEVIRAFVTGLDTPRGVTGTPAPDAAENSRDRIRCVWEDGRLTGLDVLFFGLAPRRVGVYQIDLVLLVPGEAILRVSCRPVASETWVGFAIAMAP